MAAQLRHLLELAAMPTVTIQVLPAVAHPVNASGFLMSGAIFSAAFLTSQYFQLGLGYGDVLGGTHITHVRDMEQHIRAPHLFKPR